MRRSCSASRVALALAAELARLLAGQAAGTPIAGAAASERRLAEVSPGRRGRRRSARRSGCTATLAATLLALLALLALP